MQDVVLSEVVTMNSWVVLSKILESVVLSFKECSKVSNMLEGWSFEPFGWKVVGRAYT